MKHFSTTNYTNWLRRGIRIAMLLAIFNCQFSIVNSVRAQDAFYIYRNDGQFDGFFFDEVKRMGVSKTDLNGEEHDVYVVQEVETKDSLYRIPLAAIDSVGFQQPEIRFNPRLKDFDEIGLTPYVKNFTQYQDHSSFFRLAPNTPTELVPKEGDVLVSFTNPFFKGAESDEDFAGFAGKVSRVSAPYDSNSDWYIQTTPVTELSDIFEQFISVEHIGYDNEGHATRRMAGFDYDENHRRWIKKSKGGGEITLFDFSSNLHHDGSYGSIDLGVNLKAGMDITYNISAWRIYFKLGKSFGVSLTPGATLKASKNFEAVVDGIPQALSSIKFPAAAPIFQTRPLSTIFLRGSGDLAAKLTLPTVSFNYHESLTFDSNNLFPWSFSMFDNEPKEPSTDENKLIDTGDVELSLSGFVQIGTKFLANVETNSWFEKIFQCGIGLELFVGPKIEGNVSLSVAKFAQQGAYDALATSKFTFHPISLDLAAKAYVKLFWNDPEETTFYDASTSFFSKDFYLLPSFSETRAVTTDGIVRCFTDAGNSVFWKSHAGFAIYNRDDNTLVETTFPKTFDIVHKPEPYTATFTGLPAGWYNVMPAVKTLDYVLPVRSQQKSVMVEPYIKASAHELEFQAEGGQATFTAESNTEKIRVVGGYPKILEAKLVGDKSVLVDAFPNPCLRPRKYELGVIASAPNAGSAMDSVVCRQAGNNGEHIKLIDIEAGGISFGMFNKKNNVFDKTVGIPCTVSRGGGDVINVKGSYQHSWTNEAGSQMNYSYSVDLDIDASNTDSLRIIYGTAHSHEYSKVPGFEYCGELLPDEISDCYYDVTFEDIYMDESLTNNQYNYFASGKSSTYNAKGYEGYKPKEVNLIISMGSGWEHEEFYK